MLRISGGVLGVAMLIGIAAGPTAVSAETKADTKSMKSSEKSQAGASNDFEENRKAHMQKSKENNEKKGAE